MFSAYGQKGAILVAILIFFFFFFLISKLRELKNLVPGELIEIFLWVTKEAYHLCLVSGLEGPGVEFKARLIITFASQAQLI